jgi:CRISPR-associated protein Csb1
MEEALLDAFWPDWHGPSNNGEDIMCDLPLVAVHVGKYGWITSLTAPHRIHDAILRDSNLDGARFRDSEVGRAIVQARLHDAAAFFKYCPTALLFGTWDSTGGEGKDSAKIPRAVVSEIIGVDVIPGVRTYSRNDPLGIKRQSATIYKRVDRGWALQGENGEWIGCQDNDIVKDQGKAEKYGKGKAKGKPSAINHGNIPPDLDRYGKHSEIQELHLNLLPDILRENKYIEAFAVKPGGVTMAYGMHTWTLSVTQLRRLRFPLTGSQDENRDCAARTVLAALALYAFALQIDSRGYWLRSRCHLVPENAIELELICGSGYIQRFTLGSAEDIRDNLLKPAIQEIEQTVSDLRWERKVIRTTPTPELLELVRRSDQLGPEEDVQETETADAGDQS